MDVWGLGETSSNWELPSQRQKVTPQASLLGFCYRVYGIVNSLTRVSPSPSWPHSLLLAHSHPACCLFHFSFPSVSSLGPTCYKTWGCPHICPSLHCPQRENTGRAHRKHSGSVRRDQSNTRRGQNTVKKKKNAVVSMTEKHVILPALQFLWDLPIMSFVIYQALSHLQYLKNGDNDMYPPD